MPDAANQQNGDEKPRLFISHKHSDKEIAATLAAFIEDKTSYKVKIHLSSEPKYDGPRIGRNLNEQLRAALWQTDALILLYTTEDQDWSYCMYECGLATDPAAPTSSIYVLQAGEDGPKVFMDTVRVNARKLDELQRFVRDLLRSTEFFPRRQKAVNPDIPEEACDRYADELHKKLAVVLPSLDLKSDEAWQAWPYLRLEIPTATIDRAVASQSAGASLTDEASKALLEASIVACYSAQTPGLFGRASLPDTLPLRDLLGSGPETPEGDEWVRCCLNQVMRGAQRGFVTMSWAPLTEPHSRRQYLPALCQVRHSPMRRMMGFDVYFIDVLSPEAMPARNKMMAIGNFYSLDLDDPATRGRRLAQLRQEMQRGSRSRLPILNRQNRARFIVHKSLVDEFLLGTLDRPGEHGVAEHAELTLGHLLDDPESGGVAGRTFATVCPDDTIAQVEQAMRDLPDCRDVFVTKDGTREAPVLGWITNVDIGH